jgi:hypothetical protein
MFHRELKSQEKSGQHRRADRFSIEAF